MWKMPEDNQDGEGFDDSPRFAIERFSRQMEEITWAMGHPSSINDSSQFMDFYNEDTLEWDSLKEHLHSTYQIEINLGDCLWEAAEKLYENGF